MRASVVFWGAIVGLCGLLAGSFLNVVIHRLPRRESVVWPPSHCPACGARLAWRDLVPVLSYLILRGRCRHCGGRISPRYPAVELLTAGLFLVVYITLQAQSCGDTGSGARFGWVVAQNLFFTAALLAVAFIDAAHRIIPNRLVLWMVAGAVVLVPLAGDVGIVSAVTGAVAVGGFLLLLAAVTGGGMGGGDIKFAAAAGLYLGLPGVMLGLFLGSLLGTFYGLALILVKKKSRKEPLPFGPFLALGFWLSSLWGGELLAVLGYR